MNDPSLPFEAVCSAYKRVKTQLATPASASENQPGSLAAARKVQNNQQNKNSIAGIFDPSKLAHLLFASFVLIFTKSTSCWQSLLLPLMGRSFAPGHRLPHPRPGSPAPSRLIGADGRLSSFQKRGARQVDQPTDLLSSPIISRNIRLLYFNGRISL